VDFLRSKSRAKINLRLEIRGRRDDGYHELVMINALIALADVVELTRGSPGIRLEIDPPGLPTDEGNLAFRAARAFFRAAGRPEEVRIQIAKRIPVAAGLGGGSSNAAAVLVGLNRLFDAGFTRETLCEIGLAIGADVPFFVFGRHALVRGVGEILQPFPIPAGVPVALLNPGFPVSTKWAYDQFDRSLTRSGAPPTFAPALGTPHEIARCLHNDLEPVVAARHAEIARMKALLQDGGALSAMMSGSGPTVFGVFHDGDSVERFARDAVLEPTWRLIVTGTE
jgi:4-diphosphocytidyl-2-C-methyl-D-erythritol kinase